jgi:hypothetical protein
MQSVQSLSFSSLLMIAIVIIVVIAIIYYFAYYRNIPPTNLLSSEVYTTIGIGDTVANVPMMTPDQITSYLGENFTLSFYITLNTVGITNTNKFQPIVWIVGVGALVVDVVTGTMYIVVTSTPYDASNTAPTVNTITLPTPPGFFVNSWHQITLVVTGAKVCVYIDGKTNKFTIGTNCVTLPNVPLGSPTGVYFLQGQGPGSTITSLQAYPTPLSTNDVLTNYKGTSDSYGNPTNYKSAGVTLSDLGNTLITLFCKTGLCPPPASDIRLGPFTEINYQYA